VVGVETQAENHAGCVSEFWSAQSQPCVEVLSISMRSHCAEEEGRYEGGARKIAGEDIPSFRAFLSSLRKVSDPETSMLRCIVLERRSQPYAGAHTFWKIAEEEGEASGMLFK